MIKAIDVFKAWGRILTGRYPTLSIEVTRECPLRCPGCYAYEDQHLGGSVNLRRLSDFQGEELIAGVLDLVKRYRPLHLSIVGGDPLVRVREMEVLLPRLSQMGIFVQLVTSAFRPIPKSWARQSRLNVVVSIDGLQPEHDERRRPATYDRILKNIAGHGVIVHCTVTGQMMKRAGYLDEFLQYWCPRAEVRKVWMSLFTPQKGASGPECLAPEERVRAIQDLHRLRRLFPKLDMGEGTLREFAHPPDSPEQCIFSRTTLNISADLKTRISPCQFGGNPDCSRCGCMASMALAAVGHHQLPGGITLGKIFDASAQIGKVAGRVDPCTIFESNK
ncbi:MAG: radical SAM protein [Acidobacteria bacterium]|nr:radical SAM protein [Acidobacteriota bacterium]MCI0717713.1 radical SAM protein [Acidobacteriota bacterium]